MRWRCRKNISLSYIYKIPKNMFQLKYKINSQVALFLLGAFSLVGNANPAGAVTGSITINNTDFTIAPNTLGLNNAPHDSVIDNSTASIGANSPNYGGGFGNQFNTTGDTFLLLGATNTDKRINEGTTTSGTNDGNRLQNNTNVTATFASFTVDADDLSQGLAFSFDYAFRGVTTTGFDSFAIGIAPTGEGPSSPDFVLFTGNSTYSSGTYSNTVDFTDLGLSPGQYDFIVTLTEATTTGNSAVGFDNFVLTDVVPFDFSPSLGLLLVGVFGGASYLKRKKAISINVK
jgi:hypothetical protein